jgi:hypothetical protein
MFAKTSATRLPSWSSTPWVLGVPYKRGGNTAETGFDCSGFVRAIYEQSVGLLLPRRAEQQAAATQRIDKNDLQPGDLVFFNTMRRAFSHVGIYVGDGKFIHSPKPGAEVRVESMGVSYWQRRFDGARRVTPQGSAPQDTAAQRTATLQPRRPAAQPAPDKQAAFNAATPPDDGGAANAAADPARAIPALSRFFFAPAPGRPFGHLLPYSFSRSFFGDMSSSTAWPLSMASPAPEGELLTMAGSPSPVSMPAWAS